MSSLITIINVLNLPRQKIPLEKMMMRKKDVFSSMTKRRAIFCTTRDLTIVECHVSIQFQQKSSFSISNSSSSSFNSHIQTAISSRNQMCLIWHFNLILWQKERSDECSRMKFKASLTPHQPSSSSSKAIL